MRWLHGEKCLHETHRGGTVVQVFERGDRVELRFGNSIIQSAYSRAAPDRLLLEYTQGMAAALLVCPEPEYVLHLGLGGGTLQRFLHSACPTLRQRVVEINPDVIEVAFRHFDLPVSARLLVTEGDGASWLSACGESFDLIFVDAFGAEGASEAVNAPEFFQSVRRHLSPGGWMVNNVWGSQTDHLNRIVGLMGHAFPLLYAIPVHSHSNVILLGGPAAGRPAPGRLQARAAALTRHTGQDFTSWPGRMRLWGEPRGAAPRKARARV